MHAFKVTLIAGIAASAPFTSPTAARAALPIALEVAAAEDAPPGAMQEWAPILGQMNLTRLRIRGMQADDKPEVKTTTVGKTKLYDVVGLLNRENKIVLPGGKFGQGDRAALKKFLEDLPERTEEAGIERGAFGLTKPQFQQAFEDLSATVETSTKDVKPSDLLAALTSNVKTPITFDGDSEEALGAATPLSIELKGLSTGTVLAAALRSAGLALVPQAPRGQPLTFHVTRIEPKEECWPVGWKPTHVGKELAPPMYEFTTIEINGYTLAQALDALAPHMGVPLVLDERTLAARKIDLSKVEVKFKREKSYIRRAVDMVLSQGSLAGELRVDEAGKPFYWITQFGPDSRRAGP